MNHPRPANIKKVLIGQIKAMNPGAGARKICELLDGSIKAAPSSQVGALGPLESWLAKVEGALSWVDVYDHPSTHKLVRNYLNKMPANCERGSGSH
jgi:hypothetical protein